MNEQSIAFGPVVVKVGGSLLDWPGLPARLRTFQEDARIQPAVFLAGGGRFVDVLRELDQIHRLGEILSHSLAIRSLDVTASLLASFLKDSELVSSATAVASCLSRGSTPVILPTAFFSESAAPQLPRAWSVTSDSLAAHLALRLRARELKLLKSVRLPPDLTLADASRAGIVDTAFPRFADSLPLIIIQNLRDPDDLGSICLRPEHPLATERTP